MKKILFYLLLVFASLLFCENTDDLNKGIDKEYHLNQLPKGFKRFLSNEEPYVIKNINTFLDLKGSYFWYARDYEKAIELMKIDSRMKILEKIC